MMYRWKTYAGDLTEVLNRFTYIEKVEIIKFLQESFDALFAILEARTEEISILVYNAIVFIIGLLVDSKASKVLISKLFHSFLVYKFQTCLG